MKVLFFLGGLLALSACVSDRNLSSYVCSHQVSVRLSAVTTINAAGSIKDLVARQAAIDGAKTTLAAVDACPHPVSADHP